MFVGKNELVVMMVINLQTGDSRTIRTLYPTPFHAMWSVVLQTADGPNADFFMASLSHRILTYALFITFIVAVPILFNNFLVSTAQLVRTIV